ncbi:hypothetical protein RP20_CCG011661 [Aedes albopictus]|nr:hypothetical protein RP20_CCG011661 [Aedes albopictus]
MFCFSSRAERQSSLLGSPKTENPTPNPNAGDDKRRATSEIDENAPAVRTNFTHKTAIWSTRAAVGVNGPSEKDFHAVSYAREEQPAYVLKCVAYAVEFFFLLLLLLSCVIAVIIDICAVRLCHERKSAKARVNPPHYSSQGSLSALGAHRRSQPRREILATATELRRHGRRTTEQDSPRTHGFSPSWHRRHSTTTITTATTLYDDYDDDLCGRGRGEMTTAR